MTSFRLGAGSVWVVLLVAVQLVGAAPLARAAGGSGEIRLWPGPAPGDKGGLGPEEDKTKETDDLIAGRRLIRLGNVSDPTLRVFRPPADKANGAAVVVCPGGGYHILALDLEGTEVCEWLNSVGVTGVLLKYRVPKREGLEKHAAALQDAQRAISLTRHRASEWGIDTGRIGVLGFSAGGHLAAAVSTAPARTYSGMDAADELSARPNFTVLVYPAYLTVKEEGDRISPELGLDAQTPPTFLVITQDDPVRVEGALFYSLALKKAGVPFSLHVYPRGGHGYGLRRTDNPVTAWPDRAAEWMKASGFLR